MKKYPSKKSIKQSLIDDLIKDIDELIKELEVPLENNEHNQIVALFFTQWICDNEDGLKDTIFDKIYGILEYKDLDVSNYPVFYSSYDEVLHNLKNFKIFRDSEDAIAMLLRKQLESLFFLETDLACVNCGSGTGGLIVVKAKELMYECRTCGLLQNSNGVKYSSDERVTIPTVFDLRQAKIL